ncbi:MAG: TetR/AcrR family transcriptional regulator [Chloroflexi bacterium]|nr:MAG: TetR/AcrR family transcriptional regulator [Chloroflexota bacterium]
MSPEELLSKGERTRQAVLDAAYALFLGQGYSATSMRQIAEKAGIALGGIYNHFASKDEIFQELVIAKHPYVQIFPILHTVPGDTIEEFLMNAARVIEIEMLQRPDFFKLMFIELVEFGGRHFTKLIEIIMPLATPILQRFADPNSGARPLPPLVIMRTFLGMIIGFYVTGLLTSDPSVPAEMREVKLGDFVNIYLHGILVTRN